MIINAEWNWAIFFTRTTGDATTGSHDFVVTTNDSFATCEIADHLHEWNKPFRLKLLYTFPPLLFPLNPWLFTAASHSTLFTNIFVHWHHSKSSYSHEFHGCKIKHPYLPPPPLFLFLFALNVACMSYASRDWCRFGVGRHSPPKLFDAFLVCIVLQHSTSCSFIIVS